ncbi:MAG TPA: thiamine-phosphate kinase [Balneola sp.]|jgi:thiamine-monophosphate kinase|nr:thiamine-phosphate kinase [Balneola sp.]MAO79030.1 thiamine-phosphate kinase [Balneola sp.]MBF63689.1 thiamine-phosphate kinase [Balneola sp.]HAH51631.1 thiamine-phosphate kinase [Balneola sp.]HBZ38929.1 thiamine-phosphate kinase [Balneola sp.]|tara:strand:- start:9028 stop:10056 length:1029 start_codon:yes stop_codon:yes gene_type:complete
MDQEFKSIQSVGREGLIKQITGYDSHTNQSTIKGIGDDAAVLKTDGKTYSLITSDTFVEGVHFDITYTPLHHLGYKIISTAISDIYAMNGTPTSVLINIAVPNRQSTQMIDDLYKGIYSAGFEYEVEVVGGDITANHSNMVITVTAFGEVEGKNVVYRSGAKQGDAICVTGDLGAAIAGLRILMREKKYWEEHGNEGAQPDLSEYEFVVKRQLVPAARKNLIDALKEHNITPSSMIDVTQGLVHEVSQIASASDLGAYLYQAAIPVAVETRHVADEMEEDVDRYALFGGEDLEIVFTLPEKDVEKFVEQFNDFSVVGRMVPKEDGMKMQTAEGDVISFDDLS